MQKSGFPNDLGRDELTKAFVAHNEAVKQTIPADRLLSYRVTAGRAPLGESLGVQIPDAEFPKTNGRAEFWEIVSGGKSSNHSRQKPAIWRQAVEDVVVTVTRMRWDNSRPFPVVTPNHCFSSVLQSADRESRQSRQTFRMRLRE